MFVTCFQAEKEEQAAKEASQQKQDEFNQQQQQADSWDAQQVAPEVSDVSAQTHAVYDRQHVTSRVVRRFYSSSSGHCGACMMS